MLGIYLIIGAFAGIVSGLIGIGGGIIIVPALAAIFAASTIIPPGLAMHVAIGTSLAIMIFTTLAGSYAHFQRGAVRWELVKRLLPHLLIGVVVGAIIARFLPSHFLKIIFGLFLVIIAVRVSSDHANPNIIQPISPKITVGLSVLIGSLTSILGAGGGVMIVPFLMRLQLTIHEALGTSLVCCFFVSLAATLCFMLTGWISPEKIALSTGYIYWPAFLGIVLSSVLFAPIGAALAHRLPTALLKRIFALFLVLVAIDMLVFSR